MYYFYPNLYEISNYEIHIIRHTNLAILVVPFMYICVSISIPHENLNKRSYRFSSIIYSYDGRMSKMFSSFFVISF